MIKPKTVKEDEIGGWDLVNVIIIYTSIIFGFLNALFYLINYSGIIAVSFLLFNSIMMILLFYYLLK